MTRRKAFQLIGAIAICQSAGILGSFVAPPSWVLSPVWLILYTCMGIAAWLVWQKKTKEECHCAALQLFLFQLALNTIWTFLFFGLREPLLALIEIVILLLVVSVVIWQFWKISKPASYLLVPYALWVAFAAYLNLAIWLSN